MTFLLTNLGDGYLATLPRCILIILISSLYGCIGTPPQEIRDQAISEVDVDLPSLDDSSQKFIPIDYIAPDAQPWWQEFDDSVLQQLVPVILENSTDIGLAVSRLEEAIATARASRADLFPTVNLTGQAGVRSSDLENGGLQSNPNRINTHSANFSMDWQTDLFGQLRNASKRDKALISGQAARVRDTQRLVIAQAVQNYYQIVSIRERIVLTKTSVERRTENVERIDQLLAQGYATALDKTRTDSQLYEARALLAQLELDEITLLNRLAVFAGVSAGEVRALLVDTGPLVEPRESAPLPSIALLIQHRPDLRAVERDLVAAAYSVNSSKAALYPSLRFTVDLGKGTGNPGINSGAFSALNVITGGVLANLAVPILGRGRLLAAIDVDSARLQQAHYDFESTMLEAISDLDTSIVGMSKNRVIFQQRELASATAREAAELSKELFQAGELDYTSVIVAEETRVEAENNAINAKLAALNSYVNYISAVAPAW